MRILPNILIISALLPVLTLSVPSGLSFSVDVAVVENVKNFAVPLVSKAINQMQFPDIDQDGFKVTNVKVNIDTISPDDIKVGMMASDNSIQFAVANVAMTMEGDFKYKWLFITCSGHFKATVKEGGASFSMGMPISSQTLNNTKVVPAITVHPFNLNINSKDIDITLSGSFLADIVDLFEPLFQSSVLSSITQTITTTVPSLLETDVNTLFVNTMGFINVYGDDFMFDYSLITTPQVLDTQFDIYMNGTLFNSSIGEHTVNYGIPDIQVDQTTTDEVQVSLSRYTVDTVLLTLHESNQFLTHVSYDDFKALNTTVLDALFRGLEDYYGPGKPMEIYTNTHVAPISIIKENQLGFIVNLDMTFNVMNNETAIKLNLADINMLVNVTMSNFTVYTQILDLKFGSVTQVYSTIGELDISGIESLLNLSTRVIKPLINKKLAPGIPVPKSFNNTIIIDAATFEAHEDYLAITCAPEFK